MKELILVRHAKSSWSNPGLDDIDRPLNGRGKRDAPFMAKFIMDLGIPLSHIISSPANRAYTTASRFYDEFEKTGVSIEKDHDLYFGSESDWLHIINSLDSAVKCPAFFSHNPTITYFANSFTEDYIDNVPTCGIVHLVSSCEDWEQLHYDNTNVKALYFPKAIRNEKEY